MTRACGMAIACVLLAGFALGAQRRDLRVRARAGTALIGGTVVGHGENPAPIRRALVTLASGAAGRVQVTTDDRGRFAFSNQPAGRYTLTAEKPGYVKTFFGSRRIGVGPPSPIAIADGQRVTDVAMTLVRGAVIAGSVVDGQGQPVAGAQVRVFQPRLVDGVRKFVAPPGDVEYATSDDRGRYRIYGLIPGEYVVRASGGGGTAIVDVRLMTRAELEAAERALQAPVVSGAGATEAAEEPPRVTRAATYYPGVTDVNQALTITLGAGEERTGVDIQSLLVPAARVDGVFVGPDGQRIISTHVGLANLTTGSLWASRGAIRSDFEGHWTIPSITAGRYRFFGVGYPDARKPDAASLLWMEADVDVGASDVTGVVLQFLPARTVSGMLTIDPSSTASVDPARLRVRLEAVTSISGASVPPAPVTPEADGSFTIPGVAPGRYRVSVTGPTGWFLRSAVTGGRDVLDDTLGVQRGLDLTDLTLRVTNQPSEISGTMFDRLGRPAPEFSIVVFSTDRSHWTTPRRMSGAIRLGSDGRFSAKGLPAGEYYLAALVDPDPAALDDPAFLEQLAANAIRITLAEGERKVQDIRIGR